MAAVVWLVRRTPWRVRVLQARTAGWADYRREIAASARSLLVYAAVATPAVMVAFGKPPVATPGWPVVALFVLALLVAHDSWFYWVHRAMHDRRLFKAFHRLHHRSVTPTPFAAYAFNMTEAAVEALFVTLWVLLIPTPFIALFMFLGVMIIRNVWGHCGIELLPQGFADHWFWGLFATTTHHDLHHNGGFNSNFGLYFTWWDRAMGTEHPNYRAIFREVTARTGRRVGVVVAA
ncbi:sterol desaturase family protein [Sandaracinobacteroides saxicola]|uniref:Sterol desaturase family protein n=2 Tax=Sandaracinobacteroides saxicola TaxID=2759707 RepID=A0A7G5IMW2_9SPHN|nr:sterol desaturase family protein [Sandaracinobacteroides saxicola]